MDEEEECEVFAGEFMRRSGAWRMVAGVEEQVSQVGFPYISPRAGREKKPVAYAAVWTYCVAKRAVTNSFTPLHRSLPLSTSSDPFHRGPCKPYLCICSSEGPMKLNFFQLDCA